MGPKWKYHLRLIHLYLAQLINTYLPICLILHNNTTMRNNNYFVWINRLQCFFFTLETNQDTFFCNLTNYPRYLFWYATASRNSDYDRMLHTWFCSQQPFILKKNIYRISANSCYPWIVSAVKIWNLWQLFEFSTISTSKKEAPLTCQIIV